MRHRVPSYDLVALLCFGIALSLSLHTPVVGQEQERSDVSEGWMNGRWWKSIDEGQKIAYIRGFEDGIRALYTSVDKDKRTDDLTDQMESLAITSSIKHVELDDIASGISQFYEDAANIRIPVSQALAFALMKFKGKDQRTLDDYIARLRKVYNR